MPSFPYNPRLNAAFVLFGAAYIFNFASICAVKSRVAFIRVITVYESTTSFNELFRMYISISADIAQMSRAIKITLFMQYTNDIAY